MTPPPPGLLLRAGRTGDADALAAMLNLPGIRSGTAQMPFQTPDEIRRRLDEPSPERRLILALVENEPVGSLSLFRLAGRRAPVCQIGQIGQVGMAVHDGWTGRGIGTALLSAAVELADDWMDLRRLELEVVVDDAPALALYRRFGFSVEGTRRAALFRAGSHVDTHAMARLNPSRFHPAPPAPPS